MALVGKPYMLEQSNEEFRWRIIWAEWIVEWFSSCSSHRIAQYSITYRLSLSLWSRILVLHRRGYFPYPQIFDLEDRNLPLVLECLEWNLPFVLECHLYQSHRRPRITHVIHICSLIGQRRQTFTNIVRGIAACSNVLQHCPTMFGGYPHGTIFVGQHHIRQKLGYVGQQKAHRVDGALRTSHLARALLFLPSFRKIAARPHRYIHGW